MDYAHCTINFTKNVKYVLLLPDDESKQWGSANFIDPSPKPPPDSHYEPGDYLLLKGSNIKLRNASNALPCFDHQDQMLLTADWEPMDDDMTGQDLFDLGDQKFLLWWQCVKAPALPKPAKPKAVAKSKSKTKGKK